MSTLAQRLHHPPYKEHPLFGRSGHDILIVNPRRSDPILHHETHPFVVIIFPPSVLLSLSSSTNIHSFQTINVSKRPFSSSARIPQLSQPSPKVYIPTIDRARRKLQRSEKQHQGFFLSFFLSPEKLALPYPNFSVAETRKSTSQTFLQKPTRKQAHSRSYLTYLRVSLIFPPFRTRGKSLNGG